MTIDEKKMYPGPFEDDKNVYGPLHLAPDVDQLAHAARHHAHHEHKNVKKHPEYGSSNKAGKAKYSPFDLPPKVK